MTIVEIVEQYGIDLKQFGTLYRGLCPFHNDRNNPNLTLYPRTDSWHCYACKKGGDIIQFIAEIEQVPRRVVQNRFVVDSMKGKIKKLNAPVIIDFRKETNLLVSNFCREYLQKNRNKLSVVLNVLSKFDQKLKEVQTLKYADGVATVEKVRNYLYKINNENKIPH